MKCTTDEKSMEAFFEVVVESDSFSVKIIWIEEHSGHFFES